MLIYAEVPLCSDVFSLGHWHYIMPSTPYIHRAAFTDAPHSLFHLAKLRRPIRGGEKMHWHSQHPCMLGSQLSIECSVRNMDPFWNGDDGAYRAADDNDMDAAIEDRCVCATYVALPAAPAILAHQIFAAPHAHGTV